jgi:hypothetical protein
MPNTRQSLTDGALSLRNGTGFCPNRAKEETAAQTS